ncbi:unnamed protein product [Lactuca virosa]|uniref:Uncharacterized protein n=1 Tax=Lactuca virosa TaxID=75947 RepID=A0AAU9NVW7_9ASTR|nr:unnamed protein product [Lactuca virosa]
MGLEGNDCNDNDGGRKGWLFVGVHIGNSKANVALKGKGCGDDNSGRKQYDVPVVAGTYLGLDSWHTVKIIASFPDLFAKGFLDGNSRIRTLNLNLN